MQAIILAGGFGTRLKSVVADKPKVLSPVAGKPFLHFIINFLQQQGITQYIFALGYLHEQVLEYLQENHPHLNHQYTIEEKPLGTGGGIKLAMQKATEENVIIVNADTFFEINLQQMMHFHTTFNAHCTIGVKKMENFDRYGTVEIDNQNNIIAFKEKTPTQIGFINAGYLIFNKSFFLEKTAHLPPVFSYEKDFLEKVLTNATLKAFESNGYFIDIGIPQDYALAQQVFQEKPFTK
jgi:D-glycero-alpha-D-manno-heptose 1-phosphate guanylyltransferase